MPLHDLDIAVDGKAIAVEVTRHTVAAEVKRDDAIMKRAWRDPALQK